MTPLTAASLSAGTRFILLRTGDEYVSLGRVSGYHIAALRDGKRVALHHSCYVRIATAPAT